VSIESKKDVPLEAPVKKAEAPKRPPEAPKRPPVAKPRPVPKKDTHTVDGRTLLNAEASTLPSALVNPDVQIPELINMSPEDGPIVDISNVPSGDKPIVIDAKTKKIIDNKPEPVDIKPNNDSPCPPPPDPKILGGRKIVAYRAPKKGEWCYRDHGDFEEIVQSGCDYPSDRKFYILTPYKVGA